MINQGHRVSVFTGQIGRTNKDSGIYLVEATTAQRIRRRLSKLLRRDSDDFYHWGKTIAAKINDLNRTDPIDVFEMEETFGWCADVQKLIPIPVVVKLHGPAFLVLVDEDRQTKIAAAKFEMEGRALRQMRSIIAPSRSVLASTISHYQLDPRIKKVIPNPIGVEPECERWDLDRCNKKTILFVGRFDKLKGGDTVLIAFRRLLEMDESLKLTFVGPDNGLTSAGRSRIFFEEFRNSLFTEAQRRSINYLGQLPKTDISELRRKAMLTIVASRWENQPNTALEAMIRGCPIVAFDTGGIGELIENEVTGLLARRDDIDDLCQKMMCLLNDPVRARQMGENARRFVSDRHSVRTLANETVDVYRQAISAAKRIT